MSTIFLSIYYGRPGRYCPVFSKLKAWYFTLKFRARSRYFNLNFIWWSGQYLKLHLLPYEGSSLPLKIPDQFDNKTFLILLIHVDDKIIAWQLLTVMIQEQVLAGVDGNAPSHLVSKTSICSYRFNPY